MSNKLDPDTLSSKEDLEGMKIVFTGGLDHHDRQESYDLARELGTTPTHSISHQSDLLIIGNNPGDDKMSFAQEHDVPRISQDEFYELLEDQYEVDSLVHFALKKELQAAENEYDDLNVLVDDASRELLKSAIDGHDFSPTDSDDTMQLSATLEPDIEHMIQTYLEQESTDLNSIDAFLETALRSKLGLNDRYASLDLPDGLINLSEIVVENADRFENTEEYVENALEESLRVDLSRLN